MADCVTVREVGLRDGLQMVRQQVSTDTKLAWCKLQHDAGFKEIEVTSFVPPKIIPQFSDATAVLDGAQKIEGLIASVLVPNFKGAKRAMNQGAKKITFVLSASEAHNQSNVRMSIIDSLNMFGEVLAERESRDLGEKTIISGIIATSFGCAVQGEVNPRIVCDIARQMTDMGANEISIADTVGYANPRYVSALVSDVQKEIGNLPLAVHFHDTRGMGLANVVAAADAGVKLFDACLGGLGGCPFANGATGNIATEDCVYLLESLGFSTGIDFSKLITLRQQLAEWLPEEKLWGKLSQAGIAKNFTAQFSYFPEENGLMSRM